MCPGCLCSPCYCEAHQVSPVDLDELISTQQFVTAAECVAADPGLAVLDAGIQAMCGVAEDARAGSSQQAVHSAFLGRILESIRDGRPERTRALADQLQRVLNTRGSYEFESIL